jgi:hypothetical protein
MVSLLFTINFITNNIRNDNAEPAMECNIYATAAQSEFFDMATLLTTPCSKPKLSSIVIKAEIALDQLIRPKLSLERYMEIIKKKAVPNIWIATAWRPEEKKFINNLFLNVIYLLKCLQTYMKKPIAHNNKKIIFIKIGNIVKKAKGRLLLKLVYICSHAITRKVTANLLYYYIYNSAYLTYILHSFSHIYHSPFAMLVNTI